MKYDFEECMRRLRAELQAVFKENQIKAGILQMFKPKEEKPVFTSEQQKIFGDTIKPSTTTTSTAPPTTAAPTPNVSTHQLVDVSRPMTGTPMAVVSSRPPYLDVKEINWTESQVQKWFSEKKIDASIIRNISPCDGRVLYELFMIKNETPEFFYKSIGFVNNTFKNATLRDIAHFSYELKKIFQN